MEDIDVIAKELVEKIEAAAYARARGEILERLNVNGVRPNGKNGHGATATAKVPPVKQARRKVKVTPQLIAARKLQGKYLGSLKRLPSDSLRAKVKAEAKKNGVAAAVKLAGKYLK